MADVGGLGAFRLHGAETSGLAIPVLILIAGVSAASAAFRRQRVKVSRFTPEARPESDRDPGCAAAVAIRPELVR